MRMYEDYLMLLSPPELVKHEISRYKKASAKLIGNFKSMDSPAHISVHHLERQKMFMSGRNIALLEQSLNQLPPVLLHIDGFGYFTHLHSRMTIYANIRSTPSVDEWFNQLKKKLRIKKNIVPHVTVARDIPEKDFRTLWPHFRHKVLVEPFWVNALTIARRDTFDAYAKWESFKRMEFKNTMAMEHKMNSTAAMPDEADTENQISLF